MPARSTVAAVIRAHNEGKHLGRLLEGLAAQTYPPDEIVLVDSGSTDNTVQIAQEAGCTIVHIPKEEFSFGRALNRGCAAATADVLLIVSAHVYPVFDTFVERMLDALSRPGIELAYGRQVGDDRTKFSESRIMAHWFPPENIWDQGHPFSNNANAAIRREAWLRQQYDETLTGLEDLAYAKDLLERGGKIAYVADAPVVHVHEETWSIIQNRYRREAVAYSRIFPEERMTLGKAAALASHNIVADYIHAARERCLLRNLLGIPRFRLAQFVGAWQGFRARGSVSEALLQRFYYPADSTRPTPSAQPGRKIQYVNQSEGPRS